MFSIFENIKERTFETFNIALAENHSCTLSVRKPDKQKRNSQMEKKLYKGENLVAKYSIFVVVRLRIYNWMNGADAIYDKLLHFRSSKQQIITYL